MPPLERGNAPRPRLTRRERADEERERQRVQQQAQHDARIRESRIRVAKWVGGAVVTAVSLAVASQTVPGRVIISGFRPTERSLPVDQPTFTPPVPKAGPQVEVKNSPIKQEIDEETEKTKQQIQQIQQEVTEGKKTFEEQMPRLIDISTAYFVREMQKTFPQRKDQYDFDALRKTITMQSQDEYAKSRAVCQPVTQRFLQTTPAITTTLTGIIRVNKDWYLRRGNAGIFVHDILHELHHVSAPLKERPVGFRPVGFPRDITHEKGLAAVRARNQYQGDGCLADLVRTSVEEPVVEDSTIRMSREIGIILAPEYQSYGSQITVYRNVFIDPLPMDGGFGGDHVELLGYQQTTEPDDFFAAIGRKKYPAVTNRQEQIRLGTNFAILRFPGIAYEST